MGHRIEVHGVIVVGSIHTARELASKLNHTLVDHGLRELTIKIEDVAFTVDEDDGEEG